MDEKLLRVVDLMAQLRDAVEECDQAIACSIVSGLDGVGSKNGIYTAVHTTDDCGIKFSGKMPHGDHYDKHYVLVDGVMVFCLREKEEA